MKIGVTRLMMLKDSTAVSLSRKHDLVAKINHRLQCEQFHARTFQSTKLIVQSNLAAHTKMIWMDKLHYRLRIEYGFLIFG